MLVALQRGSLLHLQRCQHQLIPMVVKQTVRKHGSSDNVALPSSGCSEEPGFTPILVLTLSLRVCHNDLTKTTETSSSVMVPFYPILRPVLKSREQALEGFVNLDRNVKKMNHSNNDLNTVYASMFF